jgi:hypothetical protein
VEQQPFLIEYVRLAGLTKDALSLTRLQSKNPLQ